MKSDKIYNVLEGFDFSLLNDPQFKEDSVREEVILPIIKGLGYAATKPYQIIRSKRLIHPYVSIGSHRKEIFIIPDYVLEVNGRAGCVIDAKAPNEEIMKTSHVEQAYSYAIHSEVRAKYYALCNGREFVLYSVDKFDPIIHCSIRSIALYWDSLKKFLQPNHIFDNSPFVFSKDLGLHLKRLGFDRFESLIFPEVPITHIAQLDPDMFTFGSGLDVEGTDYVVSFDFSHSVFSQLSGKIPKEAIEKLSVRSAGSRQTVAFGDAVYYVSIDCRLGTILQENDDEIWQPLLINKILD